MVVVGGRGGICKVIICLQSSDLRLKENVHLVSGFTTHNQLR